MKEALKQESVTTYFFKKQNPYTHYSSLSPFSLSNSLLSFSLNFLSQFSSILKSDHTTRCSCGVKEHFYSIIFSNRVSSFFL